MLRDILMPEQVRDDDEYRAHFTNTIANDHQVWLAARVGRPVGVLVMTAEWIEQLYVDPPEQRQGVGSALLAQAKALSPNGLRLVTLHGPRLRAYSDTWSDTGMRSSTVTARASASLRRVRTEPLLRSASMSTICTRLTPLVRASSD